MILFEQIPIPTTVDPVVAAFFDERALREAPRRLYRYDGEGGRYYYCLAGDPPQVRLYPSVTTIQRQAGPMPPRLLKWIAEYGSRRAAQISQEKADYGTLMHILFGEFVIAKEIAIDALENRVTVYGAEQRLPWDTSGWAESLAQDLVGIAAFLLEHEFAPLAVELPLASDEYGFAGTLDLAGYFGAEDSPTIVDFKSNRTGFYDEQEVQLAAYRTLWNENFPEFKASRLVLWGSKDWDQDSKSRYRERICKEGPRTTTVFPALLRLWEQMQPTTARRRARISGHLKLSDFSALTVSFRSLEEELTERLK